MGTSARSTHRCSISSGPPWLLRTVDKYLLLIDRHAVSAQRVLWRKVKGTCGQGVILAAGCECLPQWTYTSSKGEKYTINGTCANPGNDWNTDWCVGRPPCRQSPSLNELCLFACECAFVACRCYVNPMTCQHKPFLANNGQVSQAWDSCMGPGMNTTIDSGNSLSLDLCMLLARCLPSCC